MKNYDKNSLTGFVLMFLILLVFNFYFLPTNEEIEKENNTEKLELPSTENKEIFKETYTTNVDPATKKIVKSNFGIFSESSYDEEKEVILENEKIKLVISNKGGQIKSATTVELKYLRYLSLPLLAIFFLNLSSCDILIIFSAKSSKLL